MEVFKATGVITAGANPVLLDVAARIRRRARFARLAAYVLIAVLTIIAAGSVYVFLQFSAAPGYVFTMQQGATITGTAAITLGGSTDWLQEITRAFIRIGGVLMAVFIINILVSFARYNLKVANSLDSRADCIVLAGENMDKLATLLASLSIDIIDFARVPLNPYDTYLGVIRNLLPGGGKEATKSIT
jgi:hypothetical protein